MFYTGHNAFVAAQIFSLVSPNDRSRNTGSEIWIFTGSFRNPAPARITCNINHGCKCPGQSVGTGFTRCNTRRFFDQDGIPGAGKSKGNRENSSMPVNDIQPENKRDVQP